MREYANPWILVTAGTLFVLSSVALVSRIQTFNGSSDWDLLIFTQNWPNTVCIEWKEKAPSHQCSFPTKLNHWTIHGVWPTKLGTKGPNFCDKTIKYNATALDVIRAKLNEYWSDIEVGQKTSLWKHEWLKHGSCAASLPSLHTEIKYFSQALAWCKDYDLNVILQKKGIRPGKSYYPADFSKAVYDEIGSNPHIQCVHDPKTGLPYLEEIRICFDKQLLLVDCDGTRDRNQNSTDRHLLTNCAVDQAIVFPKSVPPMNRTSPELGPHEKALNVYNAISFLKWFTF